MRSLGIVVLASIVSACAAAPSAPPPFRLPQVEPAGTAPPAEEPAPVLEAAPAAASPAVPRRAAQDDADGDVRHLTILAGVRELDDDTAEALDVDEQFLLGVEMEEHDRTSGNGYEVGISYSSEDENNGPFEAEATMLDLYGGFRKTFQPEDADVRPYVAVGGALISGEVDTGPSSDDGETLGLYVRAGVAFPLNDRAQLGLDLRHILADIDLFGDDMDFDSSQVALTFGFPF